MVARTNNENATISTKPTINPHAKNNN